MRLTNITLFAIASAFAGVTCDRAQATSTLPEEHFPELKSLLGAAANRKLSTDIRKSEARAREKAADSYGRTRAHAGAYGAYILEDRENESLDTRARFTWEIGAERTLFEFYDAIDARRNLAKQQSSLTDFAERQEEAQWLSQVRSLFLDRTATTSLARTQAEALETAENELETLKALATEGRLAEITVLEAEIAVMRLREHLSLTQKQITFIESSLTRYTGLSSLPPVNPASLQRLENSEFTEIDVYSLGPSPLSNPYIERLETEIATTDAHARIAASESMPRVSSWMRIFQDELQGPEFAGTVTRTNYEALVGVRWNFWDSGRSRNLARAERLKGQRLERSRDRLLASFQYQARTLAFTYESALTDLRVQESSLQLLDRMSTAQSQAAAQEASILPEALQAQLKSAEARGALWATYAKVWKAQAAWLLHLQGDPFLK